MFDHVLMARGAELPGPIHARIPRLRVAAGTRASPGVNVSRVNGSPVLGVTGRAGRGRLGTMVVFVAGRAGGLHTLLDAAPVAIDAAQFGVGVMIERHGPQAGFLHDTQLEHRRDLSHPPQFHLTVAASAALRAGGARRMVT